MLVQKKDPYICVFKLATGEEIITRVIGETDKIYEVEKPLQLVMGDRGPQFSPISVMLDFEKPMKIEKMNIVFQGHAGAAMTNGYESSISGIALPQKGSIITT